MLCVVVQLTSKSKDTIKSLMEKYADSKNDIAARTQEVLAQTKDALQDNIESVYARGNTIDDIDVASSELSESSMQFRDSSKEARRAACMQMYMMYVGGFLVFVLIIIVMLAVSGVFDSD